MRTLGFGSAGCGAQWRRGFAAACTAALLGGCSGQQQPAPRPGPAERGTGQQAAAAAPAPAPAPALALDPARFTPLLALPELSAAARAVADGKLGEAATGVRAQLAANASHAKDERWWFLLGRLYEKDGNEPAALEAYRESAKREQSLGEHARLSAARLLLQLDQPAEALDELASIGNDFTAIESARRLAVRAAIRVGKPERAILTWQSRSDAQGASWQLVGVQLSEALLERADARNETDEPDKTADGRPSTTELALAAHRIAHDVLIRSSADSSVGKRAARAIHHAQRLHGQALTLAPLPTEERAAWLEGQRRQGFAEEAEAEANALLGELGPAALGTAAGCEIAIVRAKAIAQQRERGRAADALKEAVLSCPDDERARSLYLAGRYSSRAGRLSGAVRYYETLEKDFATHRLADDARIRRALAYFELGDESRFTELLSAIATDYPAGDETPNGVFHLAARQMHRGDWAAASLLLEEGARLVDETPRGHPSARGRERYFLGRAYLELKDPERAKAEWAAVIRRFPLTYYMLSAYTRLEAIDPEGAKKALAEAVSGASERPFSTPRPADFSQPALDRAIALITVGAIDRARPELEAAGLRERDSAPGLMWAVAQLSEKAGAYDLSYGLVRGLSDWIERWPAGDWQQAWKVAYPTPYDRHVKKRTLASGIEPSLAYAIMREESAFNAGAISSANAYGLMQLIEPTAKSLARPLGLSSTPRALVRPSVNIALGCHFLGDLEARFADLPVLAIPAYNAGPTRVSRWLKERSELDFDLWVELIPYKETRNYTKRVLSSRAAYALLYGGGTLEDALRLPLRGRKPTNSLKK